MATLTHARALAALAQLEKRRTRMQLRLDAATADRDRVIADARTAGVSLTAIAGVLDVSRQSLTKYLNRRENHSNGK